MKTLIALSVILFAPFSAGAQRAKVIVPARVGARIEMPARSPSVQLVRGGQRSLLDDSVSARASARTSLTYNVTRGPAVGVVVGGIIGGFSSKRQPAAPGFTHVPAALFVITYGGLGGLLGVIAGTLLPGS